MTSQNKALLLAMFQITIVGPFFLFGPMAMIPNIGALVVGLISILMGLTIVANLADELYGR